MTPEQDNNQLRRELAAQRRVATRALASYQQRALQMGIIRQQNEDLDRLASDLAKAKQVVEERAEAIGEAARLKSEFLANFSHEIRTPLNGIIGYCDLLAREEGSRLTPHGRRDLGTIKSNARTLLALINDILDLSKIESGHIEVIREPVDMVQLVEECSATVREVLKGKDVLLTTTVEEAASYAYADPLKLRQILLNLLTNAAKFTDIGEVVAKVQARGDMLQLLIEDTGSGIPPDQLPHIFEKFRQVDGSATRRKGGTGLGLAIVQELSRVLGGKVSVSSVLGRGTTFAVELPDAAGTSVPESVRHHGGRSEPTRSLSPVGARVLVVDDDPMIQQLLQGELEAEGFEVDLATDGVEGLRLARSERPTAIVLDLHLPRLNGWSVLAELKKDPELSSVPVVILSVEEQRARGFSLGAFDYVVKPVEAETLVAAVSRATRPDAGAILVVDDDIDTRQLVSRRLAGEGFTTLEAADGRDALEQVSRQKVALMILDLVMPEVDGFEVLRRLREDGKEIPVVVLTGKDLSAAEGEVLRDGLARVIKKGGSGIDDLVRHTRGLVVQRRAVELSQLPRVLYVEDIEQNRDIVRRYLVGSYQLIEAEDGEAGLERAASDRPDLILMDLSLPKVDGWEATRRLKTNPELSEIPIVALTAHASREDMDRARQAGCDAYLTKPVDCDQLIGTIRQQLAGVAP